MLNQSVELFVSCNEQCQFTSHYYATYAQLLKYEYHNHEFFNKICFLRNQVGSQGVEILIPECCIKVDFPASYLMKGTLLPSILHRVKQLLLVQELTSRIAKDINLSDDLSSGNFFSVK